MPASYVAALQDLLLGCDPTVLYRDFQGLMSHTSYRKEPLARRWTPTGRQQGRITFGPMETNAYVGFRSLPVFSVLHRIFTDVRLEHARRGADFAPRTLLDFGSGPGTGIVALDAVLKEQEQEREAQEREAQEREAQGQTLDFGVGEEPPSFSDDADAADAAATSGGLLYADAVDSSRSMRQAAQFLLQDCCRGVDVRYHSSLPEMYKKLGGLGGSLDHHHHHHHQQEGEEQQEDVVAGAQYDVVTAAYILAELSSDRARMAATLALWGHVAEDGILVIVERGDTFGSHTVRSARRMVLEEIRHEVEEWYTNDDGGGSGSGGVEEEGGKGDGSQPLSVTLHEPRVVAPCTHSASCPLEAAADSPSGGGGGLCSFAQRSSMLLQNKRTRGKTACTERFSYVVLQKTRREIAPAATIADAPLLKPVGGLVVREDEAKNQGGGGSGGRAEDDDGQEDDEDYEDDGEDSPMLGRIIRTPMKRDKHVILDVCTDEGALERCIVSKRKAGPVWYRLARKATWGGVWPPSEVEGAAAMERYQRAMADEYFADFDDRESSPSSSSSSSSSSSLSSSSSSSSSSLADNADEAEAAEIMTQGGEQVEQEGKNTRSVAGAAGDVAREGVAAVPAEQYHLATDGGDDDDDEETVEEIRAAIMHELVEFCKQEGDSDADAEARAATMMEEMLQEMEEEMGLDVDALGGDGLGTPPGAGAVTGGGEDAFSFDEEADGIAPLARAQRQRQRRRKRKEGKGKRSKRLR